MIKNTVILLDICKGVEMYRLWSKLLTWIGDLMLATEPPKIKAKHIRQLLGTIRAGDIVARKYCYYLDSYLIKGEYSHTGWVLNESRMIEAVSEDVCEIDPIDFMKDADGFILIRPKYSKLFKCKQYAIAQLGKEYDFLFNKKDDSRFYCHELTNAILRQDDLQVNPKGGIIYSDDFIKKFDVILRCP